MLFKQLSMRLFLFAYYFVVKKDDTNGVESCIGGLMGSLIWKMICYFLKLCEFIFIFFCYFKEPLTHATAVSCFSFSYHI